MGTVIGYLIAAILIALILAGSYGAVLQRRYPRERQSGAPPGGPSGATQGQAPPDTTETRDSCQTCGRPLRPGARFCAGCGADSQAPR